MADSSTPVRARSAARRPPAPAAFDLAKATKAADEGSPFTLSAPATVWYGAGTHFVSKAQPAGTHTASNAEFGDPIAGTRKAAYVLDATALVRAAAATKPAAPGGVTAPASAADASTPAGPQTAPPFDAASATRLGAEWELVSLAKDAWVYFGAAGRMVSKRCAANTAVQLSRDFFGVDPAPGIAKAAYVMDASAIRPAPTATGADLLKGTPTNDPKWFAGTELLPDGALTPLASGVAIPVLTQRAWCKAPGFTPMKTGGPMARAVVNGRLVTFPGSAMKNDIPDLTGNVFAVWAGAGVLIDDRFGSIMAWRKSGGHNGGNDSSVSGTNLATMRSHRFYKPLPTPLKPDANPDQHDYAPLPPFAQALHNYDGEVIVVDPLTEQPALFSLGTTVDGHLFHLFTGYEEVLPRFMLPNGGWPNTTGSSAAWDQKRGSIWLQMSGPDYRTFRIDLRLRRAFAHGVLGTPEDWKGGVMRVTSKDELVQIVAGTNGNNQVTPDHAWISRTPLSSIDAAPLSNRRPYVRIDAWPGITGAFSWDEDPVTGKFVLFAADPKNAAQGAYWWLDPDTLAVTEIARGGPPPVWQGTNKRFWVDKDRRMALTVGTEAEDFHGVLLE